MAAALVTLLVGAASGCLIDAGARDTVPPPADRRAKESSAAAAVGHEVPGTVPPGELAFLGAVRQVQAGDVTVGYRQLGSGPPVVLVVGQGSTMAMWGTELPRRLAERHQVTMYDLRGVGYSTDPATAPLTIRQMADDLAALIDTLGIERPTVVGWSTGGEIALTFATAHPGRAGALVLTGATAGGPTSVPADGGAEEAFRSGDLNQLLDLSFTPAGAERRSAYVQQVVDVANASPTSGLVIPDAVDRRQNDAEAAFAADPSVYDALARVDVPTLVTNGGQDRLVPSANAELIARRIPRAALHIYGDTAHIMWFQHLDRFVGDIEQATPAE